MVQSCVDLFLGYTPLLVVTVEVPFLGREIVCIEVDKAKREIQRAIPSTWY